MRPKWFPRIKLGHLPLASDWRPFALRRSFLSGFIVLCVLLCIAIELIFQGCSAVDCPEVAGDISNYSPTDCSTTDCSATNCTRRGCHVFGELSDANASITTRFIYNLLPTVFSLALGLLWSLPNHDILRLEPYFQMTMPRGATAEDSLLLQYPYTLSVKVPFVALKHKHYIVLLSSCILLLMNFSITPLISSIFDEVILTKPVLGTAIRRSIIPVHGKLIAAFTHRAYEYAWLDGPLPPFTTPTYALLPVVNTTAVGNETWRGGTTMFQADLTCESTSNISWAYSTNTGISVNITSQDGSYRVYICDQANILGGKLSSNITQPLGGSLQRTIPGGYCDRYTTFVTPWTIIENMLDNQDWYEPGDSPVNGSAVYMYAWASGADASTGGTISLYQPPHNITALFCTTSYYQQHVTATFKMPSGEVIQIEPKGTPTPFNNFENFEAFLSGDPYAFGHHYNYSKPDKLGYLPPDAPGSSSRLRRQLGEVPDAAKKFITPDNPEGRNTQSHAAVYMENVYGLSGMLLYKENSGTLSTLLDPHILTEKYRSTLQLLFAFAVTFGMVDNTAEEEVTVMRKILTKGFSLRVWWVRGAQVGLLIVTILAITLLVLNERRKCELDGEPNSLAAALRLLSLSTDLRTTMENAEFYPPSEWLNISNRDGIHYKLRLVEGKGPKVELEVDMEQSMEITKYTGLPARVEKDPQPWTETLWALRDIYGALILACYAIVPVVLIALFISSTLRHGLPTIASINSFWYKFLFSYIPISINMAMELILVTLGACHCMLGPYKMLQNGNAPSSKTLAVDYDRSPPHFQLKQSLSTGNMALAALTTAIILSNFLAVSSSGLFMPAIVSLNSTTGVRTPKSLIIRGGFTEPAQEMYYQLSRNVSNGTSAPTWTTGDYYVLPFYPEHAEDFLGYIGPSFGVGVNVTCLLVPYEDIKIRYISEESEIIPKLPQSYVTVNDKCWKYTYTGNTTKEYGFTAATEDNFIRSEICPDTIFAMWFQQPDIMGLNPGEEPVNYTAIRGSVEAVIVKCVFEEEVVELTASVNSKELITSTDITRRLPATDVTALYRYKEHRLAPSFIDALYNGTLTESRYDTHWLRWLDYLMVTIEPRVLRQGTNVMGTPNPTHVTRVLEDLYKHLFVINLRLYADRILEAGSYTIVATTAVAQRERAYVSNSMFYISISILLYTIIVLAFLHWGKDRNIVGHLPNSLVGMYVHLYASNAKRECGEVAGRSSEERMKKVRRFTHRYSYGSFSDRGHYGVYRNEDIPETPGGSGSIEGNDSIRRGVEDMEEVIIEEPSMTEESVLIEESSMVGDIEEVMMEESTMIGGMEAGMMENMEEVQITEDTPLCR